MRKLTGILLLALLPLNSMAIDESEILDYGEAFVISARALDAESVEVRWDIKPHHYMYARFLEVSADTAGFSLGEIIVPPGEEKFDELLGEKVVTFHDQLIVTVPIIVRGDIQLQLKVRSQGCLENVLCYPPTFQEVTVDLPPVSLVAPDGFLDTIIAPPAAYDVLGFDVLGVQPDQALAPENAFLYEAIALNASTVLARFTPAQGYYLYRDKFKFSISDAEGFSVRNAVMPPGTIKNDPEFGAVEVYFQQVEIPVRVNRPAGPEQTISLLADFQGCRDGNICYPPDQRSVEVLIPEAVAAVGDVRETSARLVPFTEQDRLAGLLLSNPGKAMLAFFGLGILLAFTPCVFPMVPILSGIIAGQGPDITTRKAFTLSLVYVLAMALTYTLAGVIAGLFGKNLQALFQDPWIISGFASLFVLLSLSMFGFYELQLPASWQGKLAEISGRREGGTLLGVGIMGILSALIVGPCVAPPMAAALIVIGSSGDAALGGGALFSMALGMGIPLIIVGTSAGRLLPRAGAWMDAVKSVFGVGLLALAIWMLERILDGWVIMLLWGALATGSGIFMGALTRLQAGASRWKRMCQVGGLLLIFVGAAEFTGALSGGEDWQRPLQHLGGTASSKHSGIEFTRIKSVDDLDVAVTRASAAGNTVMLDFYADWCVECKRMEKTTFRDSRVIAALAETTLLQADVTPFDAIDETLVRRFSLYGPPAILFFDQNGQERPEVRMIGYMDAEDFLAHLEIALERR